MTAEGEGEAEGVGECDGGISTGEEEDDEVDDDDDDDGGGGEEGKRQRRVGNALDDELCLSDDVPFS